MSKVKGGTIKSRLDFIKENYGQKGLDKILAVLSPEEREMLSGIILYSSWYPFSLYENIDLAIHKILAPIDKRIYEKMGAYSAKLHLNSIYKTYLKDGDPMAFCRIFPNIFKNYYDSGRVETEVVNERAVIFKIFDFASPSKQDCDSNVGFLKEALILCGAKSPKVFETYCRTKGDPHCEIAVSWD